uniref:Uncharacterized protein n=1 Tax=Geospiza parvula TaxID=87175 RepID=A0A8C3Q541_GEOPR
MGPLLVLSAPPPWPFFGQGVTRGGRGHNQAPPTFLSHSGPCLYGTGLMDVTARGGRVLSQPCAAPLGWTHKRDKRPSNRGTLQRSPGNSAACPLPGLPWTCPSTAGDTQHPHITPWIQDATPGC